MTFRVDNDLIKDASDGLAKELVFFGGPLVLDVLHIVPNRHAVDHLRGCNSMDIIIVPDLMNTVSMILFKSNACYNSLEVVECRCQSN